MLSAQVIYTPIAVQGGPAPGVGQGVVFTAMGTPVVDDVGQVFFPAFISGAGVDLTNDSGLWSNANGQLSNLVRIGDTAPGTGETLVNVSELNAAGTGRYSYLAMVGDNPLSQSLLYSGLAGVPPLLVMRQGQDSSAGGAFGSPSNILFNGNGDVAFNTTLSGFTDTAWKNQTLVNRTNDPAQDVPGGGVWLGGGLNLLNDAGHIAFINTVSVAQFRIVAGIWTGTPGAFSLGPVVQSTAPFGEQPNPPVSTPPGTNGVFSTNGWTLHTFTNSGHIAMSNNINVPRLDNPALTENLQGLFAGNPGGMQKVALEKRDIADPQTGAVFGDPLNQLGGFMGFTGVMMNAQGTVAFRSEMTGGGVTAANGDAIWYGQPGDLKIIARSGAPAPNVEGFPDATFASIGMPQAINSTGLLVFDAGIRLTPQNAQDSLWLYDPVTNELTPLLRRLQAIEVNGAPRTVDRWRLASGNGEDGRATSLSNNGTLGLWIDFVNFTGINEGIFTITLEQKPSESNIYIWDGLLNNQWWADTGLLTNWVDELGRRHDTPPSGSQSQVVISNADVVLQRAGSESTSVGQLTLNGGTLRLESDLSWTGGANQTGDIIVSGGGLGSAGGEWVMGQGADVLLAQGSSRAVALTDGTLRKQGAGTSVIEPSFTYSATAVPTPPLLDIASGSLHLQGGGRYTASSSAFTQEPHVQIGNDASLILGGTHSVRGNLLIRGTGTALLGDGATLSTSFANTDSIRLELSGNGGFQMQGGKIEGPAEFNVLGRMRWSGGEIAAGSLDNQNAAVGGVIVNVTDFEIVDGAPKVISGVLTNMGFATQASDVAFLPGGVLMNEGSYNLARGTLGANGIGRIFNKGTLTKDTVAHDASIVEATLFQSAGTTRAKQGTLSLRGATEYLGGTIHADAGANVEYRTSEAVTIKGPVQMTGQGVVRFSAQGVDKRILTVTATGVLTSNVGLEASGAAALSGLLIDGADVHVLGRWENLNRTLWRSGEVVISTLGGSAVNKGEIETIGPGTRVLGGTLENQGIVTLGASVGKKDDATMLLNKNTLLFDNEDGEVVAFAPKLDNKDSVAVRKGTRARLDGPVEQLSFLAAAERLTGGRWQVADGASLRIEPKSPIAEELNVINLVHPGTTVILQGSGTMNGLPFTRDYPSGFNNQGTVVLESGVQWVGGPFIQNGILRVDAQSSILVETPIVFLPDAYEFGTVVFRADTSSQTIIDGSLTVTDDPPGVPDNTRIEFRQGSSLSGNGTINGTAIASGKVAPGRSPGTLTLQGKWALTPTAVLELQASGTGPQDADRLRVEGDLTLAGQVRYAFSDGFAPVAGDTFPFITVTGEVDGAFDSARVVGLAHGFQYGATFDDMGVLTLNATSDGASLLGEIRGVVFDDSNRDGVRNAAEPGRAGVGVTLHRILVDGGSQTTATTTTDQNGQYVFENLPHGEYRVSPIMPEETEATTPTDAQFTLQNGVILVANEGQAGLGPNDAFVEEAIPTLAFGLVDQDISEPPDGPDLATTFLAAPPTLLSPAQKLTLRVGITNHGSHPVTDSSPVEVFIVPRGGPITPGQTPISTTPAKLNLKPGQATSVSIKFITPADLLPGDYDLVAVVNREGAITEQTLDDNTAAAPISLSLAFGSGAVKSISFRGVTYSLTGNASGIVLPGEDGTNESLTITSNDPKAKLTLKAAKGATPGVHDIIINGSLASIAAKGFELTGTVSATGLISAITVGRVSGGVQINIGGSDATGRAGFSFVAANITDLSLTSSIPITSIRIDDWDDTDATPDEIIAPAIGSISSRADFSADIRLPATPANPGALAIKSLAISGALSSVIRTGGGIGSITAGHITDTFVLVAVRDELLGLPETTSDFTVGSTASIASISTKGIKNNPGASFVSSVIAAPRIGSINLREIDIDNGGQPFGFAADTEIRSFKRSVGVGAPQLTTPGDIISEGDFRLRLV